MSLRDQLNAIPDEKLCMLIKVAYEATSPSCADACADIADSIGIPAEALEKFGAETLSPLINEAESCLDLEAFAG